MRSGAEMGSTFRSVFDLGSRRVRLSSASVNI